MMRSQIFSFQSFVNDDALGLNFKSSFPDGLPSGAVIQSLSVMGDFLFASFTDPNMIVKCALMDLEIKPVLLKRTQDFVLVDLNPFGDVLVGRHGIKGNAQYFRVINPEDLSMILVDVGVFVWRLTVHKGLLYISSSNQILTVDRNFRVTNMSSPPSLTSISTSYIERMTFVGDYLVLNIGGNATSYGVIDNHMETRIIDLRRRRCTKKIVGTEVIGWSRGLMVMSVVAGISGDCFPQLFATKQKKTRLHFPCCNYVNFVEYTESMAFAGTFSGLVVFSRTDNRLVFDFQREGYIYCHFFSLKRGLLIVSLYDKGPLIKVYDIS